MDLEARPTSGKDICAAAAAEVNKDDDMVAAFEIDVAPATMRAVFCNSGGNNELTRAIIC
jgi:hypothetical protein